jgi:hypothetical protein
MLYISSHLTFLMLAIVPPISLGAVGVILLISIRNYLSNFNQVFYGRYLKRLSNKTQEALGDMSKVKSPPYFEYEGSEGWFCRSPRKR